MLRHGDPCGPCGPCACSQSVPCVLRPLPAAHQPMRSKRRDGSKKITTYLPGQLGINIQALFVAQFLVDFSNDHASSAHHCPSLPTAHYHCWPVTGWPLHLAARLRCLLCLAARRLHIYRETARQPPSHPIRIIFSTRHCISASCILRPFPSSLPNCLRSTCDPHGPSPSRPRGPASPSAPLPRTSLFARAPSPCARQALRHHGRPPGAQGL